MPTNTKKYNGRFVVIKIKSHTGDKIRLNLPLDFVRKLIKNNSFDFFLFEEEIVDTQKLLDFLIDALNYNLTGEIAFLERNNGDIINIKIE